MNLIQVVRRSSEMMDNKVGTDLDKHLYLCIYVEGTAVFDTVDHVGAGCESFDDHVMYFGIEVIVRSLFEYSITSISGFLAIMNQLRKEGSAVSVCCVFESL
jgi:hypothetical protein